MFHLKSVRTQSTISDYIYHIRLDNKHWKLQSTLLGYHATACGSALKEKLRWAVNVHECIKEIQPSCAVSKQWYDKQKGKFLHILPCTWINIDHSNIIINTHARLNSFAGSRVKIMSDSLCLNTSWPQRNDMICFKIFRLQGVEQNHKIKSHSNCLAKSLLAKFCYAQW